jgi:uncharacterized protein with HEPN domain
MSNRTPRLLIEDILESALKIQRYTDGMSFDEFTKDEKTVDAVVRNFEVIGEASNRLPEDFKAAILILIGYELKGFVTGSFTTTLA